MGLAAGSFFIVLGGLSDIEENEGVEDSLRAENYISYKISSVDQINKDWSFWDHTYYFMDDKNQEYIEENLPGFIFENLDINSILFFDETGSFFYGKYYDHKTGEFTEIPSELMKSIIEQISKTQPVSLDGDFGILKSGENIYIVAINPILKSDLTGPSKGSFVMIKEVSDEYIEEISNEINLNFKILKISDEEFGPGTVTPEKSRIVSYNPDGMEIYVSSILYGIDNKPAGLLKIIDNRDLFSLGRDTVLFYSVFAILLCAVIIIILNYLLEFLFIRRVESISSELNRIADSGDYTVRFKEENYDEISSISDSANVLLQTIEDNIKDLRVNNEELKRTLNKKSELVAELHHRVKNNLQYIISLLGIKSLKVKDPKALEVINEATNRIKYLGLIHDDLYNKEDKESLLFLEHLYDLRKLILEGIQKEKRDIISFSIKGDEFEAELSYAIPLSTALYELLKNSTEHAFDERGGSIEIEVSRDETELTIIVKDDGKGLLSPDMKKSGFGIRNARNIITKQLLGTIECRKAETGTCWIIKINLEPEMAAENKEDL